jgi:hypothetical protein
MQHPSVYTEQINAINDEIKANEARLNFLLADPINDEIKATEARLNLLLADPVHAEIKATEAQLKLMVDAVNSEMKATEIQLKYLSMSLRFKKKEEYEAYIYLQAKEASAHYWLSSDSDEALKQLSCEPLKATTDPLKLKELEGRFPGATFILTLPHEQIEVNSWEVGNQKKNGWIDIWSKTHANVFPTFKAHGAGDKPQLMAEWNGLYIDLSHLL